MDILKKFGLTAEEITNVATLTADQINEIFDRIKSTIEDNVKNNPELYKDIVKKAVDENTIVLQKKVAKKLGVANEPGDTIDVVIDKGVKSLTANTDDAAKKLQEELIAAKAENTKLIEEVIPAKVAEVTSKVNSLYIGNSIKDTVLNDLFKDHTLNPEHRSTILTAELNAKGLEARYNSETGKTEIGQKGNALKPQLGDKTFEPTDLIGIATAILEPYAKKSNGGGGNQGGGAPGSPGFVMPQGQQLSASAQKEMNALAELEAKSQK